MKKAQFLWKHPSFSWSLAFSCWAFGKFTKAGSKNWQPFWRKEIPPLSEFGKPQRFFQLGFLLLILWAFLPTSEEERAPFNHWRKVENPSCPLPQDGYYLAEGEEISVEFFRGTQGVYAPSDLPPNPKCFPLTQPSKIEEL
jgi:hypothetical protein